MKLIDIKLTGTNTSGEAITCLLADLKKIDLEQNIVICDIYEGVLNKYEEVVTETGIENHLTSTEPYNLISADAYFKFKDSPFEVSQALLDEFFPPVIEPTVEDKVLSIDEQIAALMAEKEALIKS